MYISCECCGIEFVGDLEETMCFHCQHAHDHGEECDPADTWHCFTGYCDGSGCLYWGECEGY